MPRRAHCLSLLLAEHDLHGCVIPRDHLSTYCDIVVYHHICWCFASALGCCDVYVDLCVYIYASAHAHLSYHLAQCLFVLSSGLIDAAKLLILRLKPRCQFGGTQAQVSYSLRFAVN